MVRRIPDPPALDEEGIDRALEHLRAVIRSKGLKNSSVREAVARVALQQTGHFSVEALAAEVRGAGGVDAHPATVYRVLPLLVEAGLLQIALLSDGDQAYYERAFEREHHDHLICAECGKVVEFQSEAIEALERDVAERFQFRLLDHVHELIGVCAECHARGGGPNRTSSSR